MCYNSIKNIKNEDKMMQKKYSLGVGIALLFVFATGCKNPQNQGQDSDIGSDVQADGADTLKKPSSSKSTTVSSPRRRNLNPQQFGNPQGDGNNEPEITSSGKCVSKIKDMNAFCAGKASSQADCTDPQVNNKALCGFTKELLLNVSL